MRLLALYIRELDDGYQLATPELAGAVVTHLIDLGALIIGANRDGTAVAEDRGLGPRGSPRSRPISARISAST